MSQSVSILIETVNLSKAELSSLSACLQSLHEQTYGIDRVDEVLLFDAADVPADALDEICAPFAWVTLRRIPAGTSYGDVKALTGTGASDLLVLCDADCAYEPRWLEEIVRPFAEREDVQVVGGETTTRVGGPYGLGVALTYVFPRFSQERELTPSLWYWLNSVAVRRSVWEQLPLPTGLGVQRAQAIAHGDLLREAGHVVWRQPTARAHHQLPRPAELVGRYVDFGDETVTIARLISDRAGRRHRRGMEPRPQRIGRARHFFQRASSVLREEPRRVRDLPLAAPVVVIAVASYMVGMGRAHLRAARAPGDSSR